MTVSSRAGAVALAGSADRTDWAAQLAPLRPSAKRSAALHGGGGHNLARGGGRTAHGVGPSPFAAVDALVERLARERGSRAGFIRCWSVQSAPLDAVQGAGAAEPAAEAVTGGDPPPLLAPSRMVFEVGGNRFCRNIGRAHRSNHVYFVADLAACAVHQECHDPACRAAGFRCVPWRGVTGGRRPATHSPPAPRPCPWTQTWQWRCS